MHGVGAGMAQSKTSMVYKSLKRKIISLELSPGSPINEANLALALGVSKTPLREALRELERDGLVENVATRGSVVSHITLREIRDVFQIRELIESGAARRAAMFRGSAELARELEHDRTLLRRDSDTREVIAEWGSWEDVHFSIVKSLGNALLVEMYSGLIDRIARIRNHYKNHFTNRRLRDILVEHAAILDAIVGGDADLAETAMQLHLQKAGGFIAELTAGREGVRS